MNQDDEITELLQAEFSVTVVRVHTERDTGETTCATFSLGQGQKTFTVCADWDVDSTPSTIASELAEKSRKHPGRVAGD